MNMALLILLGELFLVMVFFLIGFGIAAWRRKINLNTALDDLVKDIEKRRPARREKLLNRLQNDYGLDDAKAAETSNELLRIENDFLKKFFAIQFTQDGAAIGTLGGALHELLDWYFDLIPSANIAVNKEKNQTVGNDTQSVEVDSAVNSSSENDSEIAVAQIEGENSKPSSKEDQAKESEAADQPGQDLSVKSGEDIDSAQEESSGEVSGSTEAPIEQEADLEKTNPEDTIPERVDGDESSSNDPLDDVATVEVSDQTESESEPEPNWDDAFAEIETQEPVTDVDASKKEEAVAVID